jgi:hypothetical protein
MLVLSEILEQQGLKVTQVSLVILEPLDKQVPRGHRVFRANKVFKGWQVTLVSLEILAQ